jgi:hypothetical protein
MSQLDSRKRAPAVCGEITNRAVRKNIYNRTLHAAFVGRFDDALEICRIATQAITLDACG